MGCADSLSDSEVLQLVNQYITDLPAPELLNTELVRWFLHRGPPAENFSITSSLDICDKDLFPNVKVLLRILAVLPATTCEAERSFSALRRLNTYLRASQTNEQLDALELIHIHCEKKIDVDKTIDTFARLHPRRLELSTLV